LVMWFKYIGKYPLLPHPHACKGPKREIHQQQNRNRVPPGTTWKPTRCPALLQPQGSEHCVAPRVGAATEGGLAKAFLSQRSAGPDQKTKSSFPAKFQAVW